MRLFIDTGSVAEVEEIAAWGVLSGATTNPTLLAKEEGDPGDSIRRICELVDGPTSAEVVEALGPNREAQVLAASMRNPVHVVTAARLGCEVSTVPYKVLKQMLGHPLTEAGIAKFADDWKSRPEFGDWLRGLVDESAAVKG